MPASSSQPTTSLIAAAQIATTPTSARVREYSRRMRPSTGPAVIASPTPQNRLYTVGSAPGASTVADKRPMSRPRAKGTHTEASVTTATAHRLRALRRWANSKPIPI